MCQIHGQCYFAVSDAGKKFTNFPCVWKPETAYSVWIEDITECNTYQQNTKPGEKREEGLRWNGKLCAGDSQGIEPIRGGKLGDQQDTEEKDDNSWKDISLPKTKKREGQKE